MKTKLNIFAKIKASLQLIEAIRQANKEHASTGNRYYVMPTSGTSGSLIIMDRVNFRKLKQKHYISYKATQMNLEAECFYCTPYRNGMGELSPMAKSLKRESYYSWVAAVRQLRKAEKSKRKAKKQ